MPAQTRVVAFGGGTGLPVLLGGLRDRPDVSATAIVSVGDDGGCSGRLRRELDVPPPGDIRNCLVALAGDPVLAELFAYRFPGRGELGGRALGNLIIAALADGAGDFSEGVQRAARLLRARGMVFPAARDALTLVVRTADGTTLTGEAGVEALSGSLAHVTAQPPVPAAPDGAIAAIASADIVVLGPGSLFTSTIAALLGSGTRQALQRLAVPVVYVANLMTQPGETTGFTVADHVRAIAAHAGPRVTDVIVPAGRLGDDLVRRYRARGAEPVRLDAPALGRLAVRIRHAAILPVAPGPVVRHDPGALARAVLAVVADREAQASTSRR